MSTEFLNIADVRPVKNSALAQNVDHYARKLKNHAFFMFLLYFLHVLTPLMCTFGVYYAYFLAQHFYSCSCFCIPVHARK